MSGKRLLALFLILAALSAGTGFFLYTYFAVKTVYVEGNVHYTREEIRDMVMQGPLGGNSLYLRWRYRRQGIEGVPFVDVMEVEALSRDTVKIKVYEKALAGYVQHLDSYLYFDKDGFVVESSKEKTQGIPLISGLSFDHIVLGERLPVEDDQVFGRIMDITKLLDKYGLEADGLVFGRSSRAALVFGELRVDLGREGYLEEKLVALKDMLAVWQGERGVLDLSNYKGGEETITFTPAD